jgi:hypothetical protein
MPTILTYFIAYVSVTYNCTENYINYKASSFYCWASENGTEGPKHVDNLDYLY